MAKKKNKGAISAKGTVGEGKALPKVSAVAAHGQREIHKPGPKAKSDRNIETEISAAKRNKNEGTNEVEQEAESKESLKTELTQTVTNEKMDSSGKNMDTANTRANPAEMHETGNIKISSNGPLDGKNADINDDAPVLTVPEPIHNPVAEHTEINDDQNMKESRQEEKKSGNNTTNLEVLENKLGLRNLDSNNREEKWSFEKRSNDKRKNIDEKKESLEPTNSTQKSTDVYILHLVALRATISEAKDFSSAYVSITVLDEDDKVVAPEEISTIVNDAEQPIWATLRMAVGEMHDGATRNLLANKPVLEDNDHNIVIKVYGKGIDEDKEIGKISISLLSFCTIESETNSKWIQLEGGTGSIRLCYYFSSEGKLPNDAVEDDENRLVDEKENLKLSVFVGTWNLSGRSPPSNLQYFIPHGQHDLYMIGTQECGASITTSVFVNFTGSWEKRLLEIFKDGYQRVDSTYLTAIHAIVFIRKELLVHLSNIEKSYVATGIGNMIGNKGGVAISFNVGRTSFLFITSHFQAHLSGMKARNADYHAIESRLPMRKTKEGSNRCSDRFERVFWAGDLNYRCLCNRSITDALLRENNLQPLLRNEQLMQQMQKGIVFKGFTEGEITFRPTYKFDVGTNVYDTSEKKRVPAWTDRVLWKTDTAVELLSYKSTSSIRTSDHKPVSAIFNVDVLKSTVDSTACSGSQKSAACSIQ